MANYSLLKSLISDNWCVTSDMVDRFGFLLESFLTPTTVPEPISDARQASVSTQILHTPSSTPDVSTNIGHLAIRGVLTKYSMDCEYGMDDYQLMFEQLDQNPNISAIVVSIDSPGGMVNGTAELAGAIKNASKPVVAFVSDLAASAAYWIASAADEIIANVDTAEVGSIGVMTNLIDRSGFYKKQGINPVTLYADQSSRKNEPSRAAEKGDYSLIVDGLNTVADYVISQVTDNRPQLTAEQLKGALYFAKDVVGTLIDSIGDFDSAVSRAHELAIATPQIDLTENNNNKSMDNHPNLAALLGVEELASMDGFVSLAVEDIATIEAALTPAEPAEQVAPALTEASAEDAEARIAALTAQNDTLGQEVEALKQRLATKPAVASAFAAKKTDAAHEEHVETNPYAALAEAAESAKRYIN